MSESLKVQKNIRANAEELQKYLAEMQTWEDEIKEREIKLKRTKPHEQVMPLPRNVVGTVEPIASPSSVKSQPAKKIKPDEGPSQVSTSATDHKNIDEAFFEKELGNKYVKEKKWNDALNCYTKAITLDPNNAVYYANRALCLIKLGKWKLAEVDTTVAIQLDKNYVKAYERRAFVRKEMSQFKGAKDDYGRVLALDPNCIEARKEIAILEKQIEMNEKNKNKPASFNYKNMFAAGTKPVEKIPSKEIKKDQKKGETLNYKKMFATEKKGGDAPQKIVVVADEPPLITDIPGLENIVNIEAITKPSHLRSKKPLRKVGVQQVESRGSALEYLDGKLQDIESATPEKKPEPIAANSLPKIVKKPQPLPDLDEATLLKSLPNSYVQFAALWERIPTKNPLRKKLLEGLVPNLSSVFGSWLETSMLSEIISELDKISTEDPKFTGIFLTALERVERFQSVLMFRTDEDEISLANIFNNLDKHLEKPEIQRLRLSYGF